MFQSILDWLFGGDSGDQTGPENQTNRILDRF